MPKINAAGFSLVQEFEGCELTAYDDGTGVWTIGWGHTDGVQPGQTITQAQADAFLHADLAASEQCVQDAVTRNATPNEFGAMVSLTFNIGCGAFQGSTVLRAFNAGNLAEAADGFLLWNKAGDPLVVLPGLTRRREAERTLFLTP